MVPEEIKAEVRIKELEERSRRFRLAFEELTEWEPNTAGRKRHNEEVARVKKMLAAEVTRHMTVEGQP